MVAAPAGRAALLTAVAMVAFAANSVLCRAALADGGVDAASFTALRLASGAATLWIILRLRNGRTARADRRSLATAAMLLVYALAFAYAYRWLDAGTGALLLFAAVQITMLGVGLWRGERLTPRQWAGWTAAALGLVLLLSPGLRAPHPLGAALMITAGAAWGVYSLLGRGSGDPVRATAANFLRAAPLALLALPLHALLAGPLRIDATTATYALLSGVFASALGYIVWYAALPLLRATTAATVQLTVPVIAALGGVLWLGETPSLRLLGSGAMVLGGVWLALAAGRRT